MDVATSLRESPPESPPKLRSGLEWQYSIVPEDLYQLELREYHAYGIQVIASDHTDILHDVSVCKKTAERIVELLNHYQVSPIHLYDVVTDMLP